MLKLFTDIEMFFDYSRRLASLNIKDVLCRELQLVTTISLFELQVEALGKPVSLCSSALDDLLSLRDPEPGHVELKQKITPN